MRHLLSLALLIAFAMGGLSASEVTHLGTDEAGIHLRIDFEPGDDDRTNYPIVLPSVGSLAVTTEALSLSRLDPETGEIQRQSFASRAEMPIPVQRVSIAHPRLMGFAGHSALGRLSAQRRTVRMEEGAAWDIDSVTITITPASPENTDPLAGESALQSVLGGMVVNPGDIARWQVATPPLPADMETFDWRPTPEADRWVKVEVERSEPLRITRNALEDLGLSNVDLNRIAAWHRGERMPTWVDERGTMLILPLFDAFERTAPRGVIWLDVRGSRQQMETVTHTAPRANTEIVDPLLVDHLERDGEDRHTSLVEVHPRAVPAGEEPWPESVWTLGPLTADEPVRFDLPPLGGQHGTRTTMGEVDVHLVIDQGRRHEITGIDLTPHFRETVTAPLETHRYFHNHAEALVPEEDLRASEITLTPRSRGSRDSLGDAHVPYLDSLEIRRPINATQTGRLPSRPVRLVAPQGSAQLLEWVDFTTHTDSLVIAGGTETPRLLSGAPDRNGLQTVSLPASECSLWVGRPRGFIGPESLTLWEPDDPHDVSDPVDTLIITAAHLRPAAERLASHHRALGLTPRVVDVQAVFDTHSGGISKPEALRDFLREVTLTWPSPAPARVILFGDASRDRRGVWRSGVANDIPTFSDPKPGAREVFWQASDMNIALIAGTDLMPDLALGRIGVSDLETANAVVDKIIAHSEEPLGLWRTRAGFVADNDLISDETFDVLCEEIRTEHLPPTATEQIYLRELPLETNPFIPPEFFTERNEKVSRVATIAIRDLFAAGQALVVYYGHGGPNLWADERIWFGCDSPRSDNATLPPDSPGSFLVNLTCSAGAFDFPDEVYHISIAEDFLRTPGGPIACLVPTGEGTPTEHHALTRELMDEIWARGQREIGFATLSSFWRLALSNQGAHLMRHFVLLGDPTSQVSLPDRIEEQRRVPAAQIAGQAATLRLDLTPLRDIGGEGAIHLIDPEGNIVEDRPFGANLSEVTFDIPADAALGRWGAIAQRWNDETRDSGAVHTSLWNTVPEIRVNRWEGNSRSSSSRVDLALLGDSLLDLPPTSIRIRDLATDETLLEETMTLRRGETMAFGANLSGEPRLTRIVLEADDLDHWWVPQSAARISQPIDLAIWEPGAAAKLTTTSAHVEPLESLAQPEWVRRVKVTFGNIGGETAESVNVSLLDTSDNTALSIATRMGALAPGEVKSTTVNLQPQGFLNPERINHLAVRFDWLSGDQRMVETVPITPMERVPDLAFVEGSLTLSPEHPTAGETIFADVIVENRGEHFAHSVEVDLAGENNRRLRDRGNDGIRHQISVGPGQRVPVRLRWDPDENAGMQTITARVDPMGRITELSERNNTVSAEIRVLTAEDVRFTRAVRHEDPQASPPSVLLTSQISNFGETDARDYVITWYRSPAKEVVIGETVIEVIRGGATMPVDFRWVFSPEELEMMRRGQDMHPTCDVGIRSGMRRFSAPTE